MPPKILTAEQVAEIDRQQQKPVNWSAVIPQREDVLTARVNRDAVRQSAPATLTADQVDAAEAQNSVAAETSFGRAMGARPDRSVGPQVPAPKKVLSAAEVDQADYQRVGDIAYMPTKDEWKRYNQLRQQRDEKVGKFIESGKAMLGGIVQAAAATAYAPFDFVVRGTKAYDEWVNSSAEGMRQAGISTAELWSWAGDLVNDGVQETERVNVLDNQLRQRLAAENRFTGNTQADAQIFSQAREQAMASGAYAKTPEQASDDEATQYQRFIRNRSFQQQAANITQTNIGALPDGRAEMGIDESKLNQGLVLATALVLDPLNIAIPAGLGAANKVRLLRRVSNLAGKPLKWGGKAAGAAAQKAENLYTGIVERVEGATGIGEAGQAAALSAVSWKAAAAMATLKGSGRVLRRVERGLDTGSILAREVGIGGVGVSRVEAAGKLRNAPIPERYRRAYDGFFTSADSSLRRVSETQGLSPIARRSAATLDKLGATQAFRVADDAVSGAVATAPIAVPLAAIAPEERQPEILGSIMTIGAGAGVIGGKMRRMSEFDDALVAKMLADAETSGGDATSMANMVPHDRLVNMARQQSVISAKADFIPLRAKDYALDATVKEAMGLGTRGIYVDAKKGQRPRIYVNLDKMATGDVAGHEIGHAILKSDILGGEVKRGMRAMTDQQYGTDGVAARGREYAASMLTQEVRDGATGIQLNVLKPDEITRIAEARGDQAAERALTDEFIRERWANDADWRKQAIDERTDILNQESLGRGDNSFDWARDEIAAETFSGLGKGLNLSGIRASGPLSRAVGAASAAFEAMGARMRGNGRLETPNRLFVENPLFDTPEMRKAVNDYVKTFDRYLVGLEKEGAVKQRGTPIAPTGKAQDAARSPHTRTYSNRDGTVIESDLFIERPDGTRVPKSQQQLDTQEKVRAATIKSINDRTKFVNENSDEWGARKLSNGRVEVGGPNLPLQFDHFVQVPEWLRAKAREFEAGRSKGRSYLYSYNAIGTGEAGSYKIKNLGNVEAKTGEMVPFGWAVSTKNHLLAKVIDLNSFRAAAIRAIDNQQLGEFGNDLRAVESGLKQLLNNYENGVAGETGLGVTRKNILNGLLGTGTVVQKASNPVWHTLNNQGSVRTFRFDRLNYADPHGTGYFPHYNKININALPDDAGRMSLDQYGQFDADRKAAWMNKEAVKRGFTNATNWQNADAQAFQAADGQYRQQFPVGGAAQRGSAMPDARANIYADQSDAVDLGGTMVTPTARNIRIRAAALPDAYHGTPHDVDSFSMKRIGTGEGAQAYGHGLYFAEHQDVAKGYMPRDPKQDASMYAEYSRAEKSLDYDSMSFWEDAMLYRSRQELADGHGEALRGRLESQLKRWDAIQEASGGNMYKVRIKADDAELLDWDKPLSEQSEAVQRAAKKFLDQARKSFPAISDNPTGGGLYTTYADHRGGNMETASTAFLDAGIKGVRYLDGNSRAQGKGTFNYVVFDESLIEITERNGRPVSLKAAVKEPRRIRGQALPDVGQFDEAAGGFLIDAGNDVTLPVHQQVSRGKPAVDDKGKPKYIERGYDLLDAPNIADYRGQGPEDTTKPDYKSLAYDTTLIGQKKINAAIDSGAVDSAANSVVSFANEAMKNPEIAAGMGWYSRMRENLLNALGTEGREVLSQLLGATSAKTPVEQNFLQAMDAYEGIQSGRYDSNRKSYLEMMAAEEGNNLTALIVERGYVNDIRKLADALSKESRRLKGDKKKAALSEASKLRELAKKPASKWTKKDRYAIMVNATGMMPKRANGKKFNANSMAVLKVIAGTWLDNRNSPKTPNFAGNLSGRTVQATIDVWAARFLRERLYKDSGKPWRIQPRSETGVNNQDFALGQIIMQRAAKKLNMNPDDLQAVLWFAEKNRWDEKGWTKNQGAEKSSFDTVFRVFFPEGKKPLTFAEASKIFEESK
jgi:hypothetical protein